MDPSGLIELTRRDFLVNVSRGAGGLAFASLLKADGLLAGDAASRISHAAPVGLLTPKPAHFPARAKACIFLYMEGGVSQVDLFDPKPKLKDLDGQKMPD